MRHPSSGCFNAVDVGWRSRVLIFDCQIAAVGRPLRRGKAAPAGPERVHFARIRLHQQQVNRSLAADRGRQRPAVR